MHHTDNTVPHHYYKSEIYLYQYFSPPNTSIKSPLAQRQRALQIWHISFLFLSLSFLFFSFTPKLKSGIMDKSLWGECWSPCLCGFIHTHQITVADDFGFNFVRVFHMAYPSLGPFISFTFMDSDFTHLRNGCFPFMASAFISSWFVIMGLLVDGSLSIYCFCTLVGQVPLDIRDTVLCPLQSILHLLE